MKQQLPPRRGWMNIVLMSVAHFMSDYFTNIVPVLLPVLALRFEMSYSQCAALFTSFAVISYMIQPGIGIWADKKDIHFLLPLSVSLAAIMICTIGLFDSYPLLIVMLMLSGICAGLFHPLSAGVVPAIYPEGRRGLATSIYIAGGNLGCALAPLLTAAFVEAFTDRYLLVTALPAVITSLLLIKNRLHHKPTQMGSRSSEVSLLQLVRSRDFVLLISSVSVRCWAHCAFMTFIPLLYAALGYSALEGAAALVVFLLGSVAGGLAAGSLADRFRLKHVMIWSYLLIIVLILLFLLHVDNSLLSLVLLFCNGAAAYAATPVAVLWSQLLLPRNASFAAAMILGFSFGVGFFASLITGIIADHSDLIYALQVSAIPAAAAGIVLLLFVHEPRRDAGR